MLKGILKHIKEIFSAENDVGYGRYITTVRVKRPGEKIQYPDRRIPKRSIDRHQNSVAINIFL